MSGESRETIKKEPRIIIPNEQRYNEKKERIAQLGVDAFQVVADFDGTLTSEVLQGKRVPSVMSILRDYGFLTPEYSQKAQHLFNTYHGFEQDPHLQPEERKAKMHEWWKKHFDLLIATGLQRQHIEQAVDSGKIAFRDGIADFVQLLEQRNIPLLILSSSGLGVDSIELFFERAGLLRNNIHIVSNQYIWNDAGVAIGIKEPIIHSLNKDETVLHAYPFFNQLSERQTALVLGNSLGDADMTNGLAVQETVKLGFTCTDTAETVAAFSAAYDAVLLDDPGLKEINTLIQKLFPQ